MLKKTILSVIITSTFTLNTFCDGNYFPASLPTIRYVTSCPDNKESWDKAANLKKCEMLNNYTSPDKYEYHCVLNKEVTKLLEVCVPVWFLTGNCARYSIRDAKIWNSPDTECTTFSDPCPIRYNSTEAYKYQDCYKLLSNNANREDRKSSTFVNPMASHVENSSKEGYIAVIIIFAGIIAGLIFVLVFREKNQKIFCKRAESQARNACDTEPLMRRELSKTTLQRVSGSEIECIIENVETIADLKEALVKSCMYQKDMITIVKNRHILPDNKRIQISNTLVQNEETGDLNRSEEESDSNSDDEIEIRLPEENDQIRIMIGNASRKVQRKYLSKNDNNVISGNNTKYVCVQMSCSHSAEPYGLYEYTKMKVIEMYNEIKCPLCNKVWKYEELKEKCDMSTDEIQFYRYYLENTESTH